MPHGLYFHENHQPILEIHKTLHTLKEIHDIFAHLERNLVLSLGLKTDKLQIVCTQQTSDWSHVTRCVFMCYC